jgi:hypothetical protein
MYRCLGRLFPLPTPTFQTRNEGRPHHYWATADYLDHPPLQTHFPSKYALLSQARLDLRDPRFGLTQRLGACVDGMRAQDEVVIMWHG